MKNQPLFSKYLYPGGLVISLLVVYLLTLAPGLTWANGGSDGGDLITATATGGIAHPTGYPLYLLAAKLFQSIPVGSLAFRTNLMSAIFAVSASLLVYGLVVHYSSSRVIGLVSAFSFGLSPLMWSQAVITEVYAIHAFFVALILYLSSDHASLKFIQKNLDHGIGLMFGLALGNHLTTVLLFPILLYPLFSRQSISLNENSPGRMWLFDRQAFLKQLTGIGVGLSVYLILPLRAVFQPPINWGNPRTLDGFVWLVSGKLYQDQLLVLTLESILTRTRAVAALLIDQFGIPGLLIGLIGLVVYYKPSPLFRNTIWTFFAFSAFAIAYATHDSYIYLIPAFLCFAVWIGLGLNGLAELASKNFRYTSALFGVVFLIYIFILAGTHWSQVDASKDLRAEEFGNEVLIQAPANAILFVRGDKAIFTMWYFHFALHDRQDLLIVVTDLLGFDWYQDSLISTYPALKLSGPIPSVDVIAVENPSRPTCQIEYIQSMLIDCLPAWDLQKP